MFEDYSRYVSDKVSNNKIVKVLRKGEKIKILSMDIMPGDFVYVSKGEQLPVDVIIMSSSYDDGTCFIETSDLDGYNF
jgi:phospholipid-transporting ATPase